MSLRLEPYRFEYWRPDERRLFCILAALVAFSCSWLVPGRASAQESDTCRRIRAEADSRAAMLLYPKVHVQGVRLPSQGDEEGTGLFDGNRWQARASVSVSPMDMVRGVQTHDVAEAFCERHEAQTRLEGSLELGMDLGREQALQRQIAYLDQAIPRMDAIVAQSEQRLAKGLTTFLEINQLRLEVMRTKRKALHLRAEIEQLRERDLPKDAPPLATLLASYESRSLAVAREQSSLRRLEPWQVSIRGGVIPDRKVDYFGLVEVSYNFGDIAQRGAEKRYLEARRAELASSRAEFGHRAKRLQRQLAASVGQLESELRMIDQQLDVLNRQKELLDRLEAPGKAQALALVEVQMIPLESERVYARALLSARKAYRENA